MRMRWLVAAAAVIGLGSGGAWLASALGRPVPVVQPIAFNHEVHVKGEELQCVDCHQGDKQARSGFGDIRGCHECHSQPAGENPSAAEEEVREYGKAKRQIPWVAVNRNRGHVYFSHRAHVAFADIKCEDCHGAMGSRTTPIALPDPRLHSMARCIDCHRERGASLQCISCHK